MSTLAIGPHAASAAASASIAIFGAPGEHRQDVDDLMTLLALSSDLQAVWVVCGSSEEADRVRSIGLPTQLELNLVDARGDLAGVVGNLFGAFMKPDLAVVVLDVAGRVDVRRAIRRASGYAGTPMLTRDSDGRVLAVSQSRARPSLVLGALRFSLTTRWSDGAAGDGGPHEETMAPDPELLLAEAGFETLVKQRPIDGAVGAFPLRFEATALLHALLADPQLARASDHSSACADLMERRGRVQEAKQFRKLTQRWVEQRLWDSNFVPEMVLHNDAHAAAVDRNIASICEPLLENGYLDDLDLIVLAVAAWLHDWGHASARDEQRFCTNPVDVRNYHGVFTAARLMSDDEAERHGLADLAQTGICADVYWDDVTGLAKDVALLSAHHQGWTDCDNGVPNLAGKLPEDSDNLKLATKPGEIGFIIRSFADDYKFYTKDRPGILVARRRSPNSSSGAGSRKREHAGTSELQKLAWERARLRLAILRVADAADLGVHRVPDYDTQQASRDGIAAAYLARQARLTKLALSGWRKGVSDVYGDQMTYVKARVSKVWGAVDQAVRDGHLLAEGEIKELFRAQAGNADLLDGGLVPKPERRRQLEFLLDIARESYRYCRHLIIQRAYYDLHDSVRVSIPVLERISKADFQFVVYVVANGASAKADPARAVWLARRDVAREWGWVVPYGDGDPVASDEDSEKPKQAIARYLAYAHIRPQVDGREVVLREPNCHPAVLLFNDASNERDPGRANPHAAEDVDAIVKLREAGMAVSPDGAIGARVVPGGVEVVPLTGSWPSRVAKLEEEEISVLAVDGSAGPAGPSCRVLVTWPGGTALVHRGLRGRDRPWHGQPSLAGALLGDRVILVDRLGHARQLVLDQPGASTAVGWLCDDEVGDLDVLATDGSLLVAASVSVDSRPVVKVARFAAGDWEQVRSLAVASQPIRVAWDRDGGDPALLVISEGSHEAIRLDDKRWQFS